MRASVTLDDDLLKMAHEYTGMTERALKGEPSDHWSIEVSGNWRVDFRF